MRFDLFMAKIMMQYSPIGEKSSTLHTIPLLLSIAVRSDVETGSKRSRKVILRSPSTKSAMSVAVIQGASGGLGKAFIKHLLTTTQLNIVATSRDPASLKSKLLDLYAEEDLDYGRLKLVEMDIREESTIAKAAKEVEKDWGKGSLKLLLNTSGVVRRTPSQQ